MVATPTPGTKDFFTQSNRSKKDGDTTDRDTANTPEILWRPALNALDDDQFDLDPFSNGSSIVPARVRWTIETDKVSPTLGREWHWDENFVFASVWVNHPWSMSGTIVPKTLQQIQKYDCRNVTWLTKLDSRCNWWKALLEASNGYVCLPTGYYRFDGHSNAIPHPISIFPINIDNLEDWI